MFGLFLRAIAIAIIGTALTACGTRPKPMPEIQQIYEIRAVAVTANADIPRAIMRGIKVRLDKAIDDTRRPVPMPRAVMNIHIVSVTKSEGTDGTRNETEVSVTLTDVPSGQALLGRNFLVYSFSINGRDASNSAAEAVASRLRAEYALSQPVIRQAPAYEPRVSTRMKGDDQHIVRQEKSIVIPLRTAPVLGADQDPVLNSRTRVKPVKKEAAIPEKQNVKPEIVKPEVVNSEPADNAVEAGAKVKVVIRPKAAEPASAEPCVETMDKKC
ncbi:MAG: hypothetical protein JWM58_2563 [Rhizobium sp.]|nr:hypothetical protein [Rhizobium sp.]